MTKEYQEAERRLREQAEPVGDADLRAQVARLEAELARASKDAGRKDEELRLAREDFSAEAWEQTLQELEQAQAANAAKDAALTAWAEDIACPECADGTVTDHGSGEVVECGHCEGTNINWPRFYAALSDTGEGLPLLADKVPQPQSRSEERRYKVQGWLPPEVREQAREALKEMMERWPAVVPDATPEGKRVFVCGIAEAAETYAKAFAALDALEVK